MDFPDVKIDTTNTIEKTEIPKVEETAPTTEKTEVVHKDEPVKETVVETAEPVETEPASKTFNIDEIEVREDGMLELKVNPDDPDSTVYVGKDAKELIGNIRKGITEKDTYIGKLKKEVTDKTFKVPERVVKSTDDGQASELEPPDIETFRRETYGGLTSTLQAEGLTMDMLFWSDEKWDEYQTDKGLNDRRVGRLQTKAESIRKDAEMEARKQYGAENLKFLNGRKILEEDESVREFLNESGVLESGKFTPDQYEAIIKKVTNDPAKHDKYGLLKSGAILLEVQRAVSKPMKDSITATLRKNLEDEIAKSDASKEKIKSSGTSGAKKHETINKPPSTYEEARERALKALQG